MSSRATKTATRSRAIPRSASTSPVAVTTPIGPTAKRGGGDHNNGAGGTDTLAAEPALERLPPLGLSDKIVIARAAHGGFVAAIGVSLIMPSNTAAFSHAGDLQTWLDQMIKRWRPLVEHQSPRP